ncbi:MAG: hypothetical protein FJ288_08905 [Planctomycetes bacterium]|nr:hypothetical protein [Planctomycetota bacterium]
MRSDRPKIYGAAAALDGQEERRAGDHRGREQRSEVTPGGPPCRLLWLRTTGASPGDPPDERYYADEVRPAGADQDGHMTWQPVPGGLEGVVLHNAAEAGQGTHGLASGTVVRAEERLDRGEPPDFVYLAYAAVPPARLARIESYDAGYYTVQPVRREEAGFVDDGPPLAGVPNLGELWGEEAGYLAGPEDFDRYVWIFGTPAGWAMLLHPPRMV